jgi:hypothetical protein
LDMHATGDTDSESGAIWQPYVNLPDPSMRTQRPIEDYLKK